MTRLRIALYSIGLLLLLSLGAGFYYYQNFPLIVEQQAKQYLQDYGVQSLRYEQLKISHQQLRTDTLHFSGEYNDLSYTVDISSLAISYNWRMLLIGAAKSVKLGRIELSLTEKGNPAGDSDSVPIDLIEYLPRSVLDALPVESLGIELWQLNYHPANAASVSATGSLQLSDQLQLQLQSFQQSTHLTANIVTIGKEAYPRALIQVHDSDIPLAAMDIELTSAEPDTWQWALQGELDYAPLLAWLRRMNKTLQSPLDLSSADNLLLSGNTEFNVDLSHPGQLTLPDAATAFDYSSLEVQASTLNVITELNSPSPQGKISGELALDVNVYAGELSFTLGASQLQGLLGTAQLGLPDNTLQWLGWTDTVPVQWSNPGDVLIAPTASSSWAFQLENNLLVLGDKKTELRWENLLVGVALTASDDSHVRADVETRLNARLRKKRVPPINLSLTFDGTSSQNSFQLTFQDVAESLGGALQGDVSLSSGQGSYHASLSSEDLPYASETFLPLLQDLKLINKGLEISLSSGSMTLDSKLQSSSFDSAGLKQQSQLKIANLSGVYDEYQFEGIALDAQWSGIEQWQTQRPANFSMKRLNMGFELLDTHALLSLPKATAIDEPTINLDEFSTAVFGGRVYLPEPHVWDFAAKSNRFTLRAEDWRLADMVALQQGQEIQAQGTLEGALPVTVTGGRIIIAQGYLRALAPGGTIRYIANESSRALAASSPELGMALDLLSDFQYEVLSSEVELDEAGNLSLGLSLAGKNPALFDGRAVNFNINLEQNLDPLLQSLRLSDKLVEQLESRIN
ncbi:MAG: YdbH domain-containing protein [Halioglobus sp.]